MEIPTRASRLTPSKRFAILVAPLQASGSNVEHLAEMYQHGRKHPLGGIGVFAARVEIDVDRKEQRYGRHAKHA